MKPPLKTEEWTSWWMPWLLWTGVGLLVAVVLVPVVLWMVLS